MNSKGNNQATKEGATPALVPKLRFPEFQNAGGWEPTSLGGVARLRNGYAFKSAEYVEDGPYKIITIANVQQGNLAIESTKRMAVLPCDIQQHQVLSFGDILVSMTGNVGRVCRVTAEGLLLNQRVGKLVPGTIDDAFFYQLLQGEDFRSTMQLKAAGGAQGNLSAADIIEYAFNVPTEPAEQQKIAECLSSVDELIAAQAQKLNALKTHKKGLMQQLFPREGETQPRLRFPEFQNAGDWEPKTLIDACSMQAGKFVPAADIKEQNVGEFFPCFGGNGLRGFTATHTHVGVYPLIGRQGALCGNIKLATGPFHATEHAVVATPNQGIQVIWLYYLLDLLNLNRFATGQAQPGLSVDVLDKVPVTIPNDEREQHRIASCLSSLDALITAETQKNEALKTHKKGLMQQLFPSLEASTA